MEAKKQAIAKTPIPPSILVKSKPRKTMATKRVHFAPFPPETKQGQKRKASPELDEPSTTIASKCSRTEALKSIPPRVQRIIRNVLKRCDLLERAAKVVLPPKESTAESTNGASDSTAGTSDSTNRASDPADTKKQACNSISNDKDDEPVKPFNPPTKPLYPLDKETDWFTSMHAYASCKAYPIHVIGVKSDQTRKQCEGSECLDARLLQGEVNVIFHSDREQEPVCETCWTMDTHPQLVKDKTTRKSLRMPGSWPADEEEGPPHRHAYQVIYRGCKLRQDTRNPLTHAMKLVKHEESVDGKPIVCRCNNFVGQSAGSSPASSVSTIIDGSHEKITRSIENQKGPVSQAKPSNGTKNIPRLPIHVEKLYLPHFAGCPACDGKKLRFFAKRLDEVNNKKRKREDSETDVRKSIEIEGRNLSTHRCEKKVRT
ncbi:hypothetical protein ABW21_db0206322 [Orbilia brochopaga]|nr:hypothetical protein ABW21_db0206322 [Drechslerella brochopaga]